MNRRFYRHLTPVVGANRVEANLKIAIKNDQVNPGHPACGRDTSKIGVDRALSIWIDEIKRVPRIRTMEEALELRNDCRAKDFRDVLFEWAPKIRSDPSQAQAMRKEIVKAHKELEGIKHLRRFNGCLGTALVSLDVAKMLAGGDLFAYPLGIVSFALGKLANCKERHYDWILFGSG